MGKKILYCLLFVAVIVGVLIAARECRDRTMAHNGTDDRPTLYASIYPLKFLIDRISGSEFNVEMIVPTGASPETYEPTHRQSKGIADAPVVFTTGLMPFEKELLRRITETSGTEIADLSAGIDSFEEHCHHGHAHGVDPHIWSSPDMLKIMASNAAGVLSGIYPGEAEKYSRNLAGLHSELDSLDRWIGESLASSGKTYFMIYHPALTYYANDYGLTQIAIEQDGKEPSAEQLKGIVALARKEGIKAIMYQKEFSASVVKTVAADIGATAVEIDPLAEDVVGNLRYITGIITGQ